MTTVNVNNVPSLEGTINEPRQGPWTALVHVDIDDEFDEQPPPATGDRITIDFGDGGALFAGTVTRASIESGRWIAKVVGGGGGFSTELPPKYYSQIAAQAVITDLLTACGESLDPATDPAVLSHALHRWARAQGHGRGALSALARELSAFWRVTRAGLVYLAKAESNPTVDMAHVEVDRNPSQGLIIVTPDDEVPLVRPGTTFEGEAVAAVTTSWDADGVRQRILVADGDASAPRGAAAALADAMRRSNATTATYSPTYPAKVIKQDPTTGELDLYPDDARIRGSGLSKVPLRSGIPGVTIKVKPGERVGVYFEEGNPSKPAACLWPDGSGALELHIAADVAVSVATASGAKFEIDAAGNITAVPTAFVNLGAAAPADAPALNNLVTAQLNVLKAAIAAAPVAPMDGGATFKAALVTALSAWPQPMGSLNVRST